VELYIRKDFLLQTIGEEASKVEVTQIERYFSFLDEKSKGK
jgi:hypothetical protein